MPHRYTSFGSYVKKTFGTLVQKVNIDAGFTCPNRDGTVGVGGCVFCNNESFKPGACRPALSVREQVQNGIAYLGRRYGAGKFLAYFQAYTNTYAPVDELERIYTEALEEPSVVGLAIGTRPDCVDISSSLSTGCSPPMKKASGTSTAAIPTGPSWMLWRPPAHGAFTPGSTPSWAYPRRAGRKPSAWPPGCRKQGWSS
jgi:hypothetical protein